VTFGLWARRAARLLHPASDAIIIRRFKDLGNVNPSEMCDSSRKIRRRARLTAFLLRHSRHESV